MMTDSASSFPFLSDTAMILAAGFGKRMQPLTLQRPKPLLEIDGRSMLDRAIDHVKAAGVRRVIVNAHYLADQIEAHVRTRRDIEILVSHETDILDTGGGVKKARAFFGGKPFFLLGGDMPWFDGSSGPALTRLANAWDEASMDELLLLYPTAKARGFGPRGDFMMEADGRVWRKESPSLRPYVWISAQIVRPELYDDSSLPDVFSNNLVFDRVEAAGRLYGLEHDGTCYHVGTPDDLAQANALLTRKEGWG